MNSLKQMQNIFQEYLITSEESLILPHIVTSEAKPAIERISIYQDAYKSRLMEALASNFPFLKSCLMKDEFDRLASSYIDQYPSTFKSIRWFGDKFPNFIKDHITDNEWEYIYEIARLDWVMTLVFDAQDCSVISIEDVSLIPPENWPDMHFTMHYSLFKLEFEWNVVEFWQSTLTDEQPISLLKYQSPMSWIFWRNGLDSQFASLFPEEALALQMAMDGSRFSDICETLCQSVGEEGIAITAATFLKKWIIAGMVSKIIC